MENYYVNNRAQENGDHEVHEDGCYNMPSDKKYLGRYSSCHGAVEEAKNTYHQSNGCKNCCKECHTS